MEPSEIFHTKSIYTERSKCLCNCRPPVCKEVLGRRENVLPLQLLRDRMRINQGDLTILSTRLTQHPQNHFISFHISEQQTIANF
jgi:hypothetical protein